MDSCFRIKEMAFEMIAGGWEIDSDEGTNNSGGMGASVISVDALYDAGLYGGGRRTRFSSADITGLDPEEEENFRRETRCAEKTPSKAPLRLTESMENLIMTFPLICVDGNKIAEEEEVGRATTKAGLESGLASGGSSKKFSPKATKEKEALEEA